MLHIKSIWNLNDLKARRKFTKISKPVLICLRQVGHFSDIYKNVDVAVSFLYNLSFVIHCDGSNLKRTGKQLWSAIDSEHFPINSENKKQIPITSEKPNHVVFNIKCSNQTNT